MVNTDRKSSTTHFRNFLREMDYLVDQYRVGAVTEQQCISLYMVASKRMRDNIDSNFHTRLANSKFFREPTEELGHDASPVSRSDG